jgi:type I restriction enzyme R subunit
VIREICEEVSNQYEIKRRIIDNRENDSYLKTTAVPKVKGEVKNGYIKAEHVGEVGRYDLHRARRYHQLNG